MDHIIDRLIVDIKAKNSVVCIGLDPVSEPADSLFEFNKKIIDATHDIAVAFKPQIAYYEQYGAEGMIAFKKTIDYIHAKGVIAIDDSKRGDIGSTATAYAKGHFEGFGADAMTINPYAGSDGLAPFLEYAGKGRGLFVWARSSNPSASELQDVTLKNGEPAYTAVANLVHKWGQPYIGTSGYSAVGAVVGATYPEEAKKLRALMPSAFWLVPGYGAQGGTAEMVKDCFDANGLGAIINSSRAIIYDKNPREAAISMRDELNNVRKNVQAR